MLNTILNQEDLQAFLQVEKIARKDMRKAGLKNVLKTTKKEVINLIKTVSNHATSK